MSNFQNIVIPFVIKNTCATYQQAMIAIFTMLHDYLEDYIDDTILKS